MMRTFFISIAASAALLISSCGFTPMHGSSATNAKLADIQVDVIKGSNVVDNQAGFFVTQRLRDRIGNASDASPYRLEITPAYRRVRFGLTDADIASRYEIIVTAKWSLFNTKTGKSIDKGSVSAANTFGASEGPYGIITADNIGVEQASKETADKLVLALARALAAQDK